MSGEAEFLIGIVAEGITDHVVLAAILEHIVPHPVRTLSLQPEQSPCGDHGVGGAGWKGVRGWCRKQAAQVGGIEAFMSGSFGLPLDLLVVHLDADVAADPALIDDPTDPLCGTLIALPCPPASDTTTALAAVARAWLAAPDSAPVVVTVPAQATDAWILVAHFPDWEIDLPCVECAPEPDVLLTREPFRRLRTKDGKPKKPARRYRELAPTVVARWDTVRAACGEAQRFHEAVERLLV